ncbi:MAG: hypothetical protein JWM44_1302 [Bacilli bacterium]|nr:hypothetical protein [Bacilli bacterium]
MNTLISRIWMNNRNNFVISDDLDKHAAAEEELIAKGGKKLECAVFAHDMGEVIVVRSESETMNAASKPIEARNLLTRRQARMNLNITLEEAAERSGVPVKTIQEYEKDSRDANIQHFINLVKIYRISAGHVYIGETPEGNRKVDVKVLHQEGIRFDIRDKSNFAEKLRLMADLVESGYEFITIDQHDHRNYRAHLYHPDNERSKDDGHDS